MNDRSPSQLLASLSVADFELLRPHLRFVELKRRAAFVRTGELLTYVYLPDNGVISLVVRLLNGDTIEAASRRGQSLVEVETSG